MGSKPRKSSIVAAAIDLAAGAGPTHCSLRVRRGLVAACREAYPSASSDAQAVAKAAHAGLQLPEVLGWLETLLGLANSARSCGVFTKAGDSALDAIEKSILARAFDRSGR
jgi:hypothetical protein